MNSTMSIRRSPRSILRGVVVPIMDVRIHFDLAVIAPVEDKTVTEICFPVTSKNVFIGNGAPCVETSQMSLHNFLHIGIGKSLSNLD